MFRNPHGAAHGFTIIELMGVIGIMAILVTIAAPNFIQLVKNQRVKSASFDVFSSLVVARSEALTRNTSVTITPVSSNWANGWQVTAGAIVLRSQDPTPGVTITGPASITYTGTGRLSAALASGIELTAPGATAGVTSRCITVDLSGRPLTKATVC